MKKDRTRDIFSLIKENNQADHGRGGIKRRRPIWPVCLLCNREPFRVELSDINANTVEIRAWCYHKPYIEAADNEPAFEDWIQITIPFGTSREEHIGWALKNGRFFDPTKDR